MKRKLLFVIASLDAGGAEKSLVNLLNVVDKNRFEIDLLMLSQQGLFIKQIPPHVSRINSNKDLKIFQKPLFTSVLTFLLHGKFSLAKARLQFFLENRKRNNKAVSEQQAWRYISKSIKPLQKKYDASIAFLEKSSIYYVVDFVDAPNKIGFIHNDYNQLGLDFEFDKPYFERLNHIATVSTECRSVLQEKLPHREIKLIHNISSSKLIWDLAEEVKVKDYNVLKLLTVGRLHEQKGLDIAIEAARILKDKKINFIWQIIGEGSQRAYLQKLIQDNNLQNEFLLIGLKSNPYPYILNCDIYVQPSRYEGKSIAVDEALILQKPIVVTDFTTARDQIIHGVNGLVSEMNADSLANTILTLRNDKDLIMKILRNFETNAYGNEYEVEKFYNLIDE